MNSAKTDLQHIKLIFSTCLAVKVKNKKTLTWGGSPLCKDANFPPHQSHAVNQLSLPHRSPPLSLNIPLEPFRSCDIFNQQKMTSTHWNLLCPEQYRSMQSPTMFNNYFASRLKVGNSAQKTLHKTHLGLSIVAIIDLNKERKYLDEANNGR